MSLDDHIGVCPECFCREGPVHAFGLLYHYCLRHRYRWTTPARFRQTDLAALAAVRQICQKTTLIIYARHPDQLGLTRPSAKTDATKEEQS
jgi:hypothetical protein